MISFSNINKQYGKQLLFVDDSFQLNPGEKVGLVGPNGQARQRSFLLEANGQAGREAVCPTARILQEAGHFFCAVMSVQSRRGRSWCREGELNPQGTKYRRILRE
jgi:hypothetical protein